MKIAERLAQELKAESLLTKKLLERIPDGRLGWKPHPRSMPIGRLGLHIAELPLWIHTILTTEELDFGKMDFKPEFPKTTAQIPDTLEKNLDMALSALAESSDAHMQAHWRMANNGVVLAEYSRRRFVRREIKHTCHHRGQLTVFLRLLDIPVPATLGPSADEPF